MDDYWRLAIRPLRNYADFSGRASRAEFWLFHVFAFAIATGCFAVASLAGVQFELVAPLKYQVDMETMSWGQKVLVGAIGLFLVLALMIPLVAVTIRRLHDLGWSGWMILPYLLFAGWNGWGLLVMLPYLVAFAWPGQKGDNDYGITPEQRYFEEANA